MGLEIEYIWHSGVFLLYSIVLFIVARALFKLFNKEIDIDHQLTEQDNLSFFLSYIGYFTGFLMILWGILSSEGDEEFLMELAHASIYGVIGLVFLNLNSAIMRKVIYPKINLTTEITKNESISAGLVKGTNYLLTGIIIGSCLMVEVNSHLETLVFLVLAIVLNYAGFYYYKLITPYDVRKEITKNNIAATISASGAQVAFAILIFAAFQIEHSSWIDSFKSLGIEFFGGLLILPMIRLVVDKIFLKHNSLSNEIVNQEKPNIGAGMFEAMAYIGGALLLVWCWNL